MRPLRPATVAAHAGLGADPQSGAVVPPIQLSQVFVHGNAQGNEYGRYDNATWRLLEEAISALEEGAATCVVGSGMAAIAAALELVPVGATVVGAASSYSGTRRLLRRLEASGRLRVRLVDIADTDAVAGAAEGAALVCLETITNPMIEVCDVAACAEAGRLAGALVLVDNTFATPLLCRPLTLGADLVVHSLTKYVGGHSDLLLGAVTASTSELAEQLRESRSLTGSAAGQLETWLALRGLRTLDVRFRRQCTGAAELARRLEAWPAVARVRYPGLPSHAQHERARRVLGDGFGAVLAVEVRGGAEAAERACSRVRLWSHTTSLGGVESTLERRARYPLDAEVAPENLLRLSVGIEDVDDLADDLAAALGD